MLYLATACGPQPRTATAGAEPRGAPPDPSPAASGSLAGPVEVWSWFDLPDDPRSRELSGITWDATTNRLWAVQDRTANLIQIIPNEALSRWAFGPVLTLDTRFALDLEGIVATPEGFVIVSENGPHMVEVDRAGKLLREVPLPGHYANYRANKSLESVTMSPGGRYLFTTNEEALTSDGPKATVRAGTRVRILRASRAGADFSEHAYLTDPLPHDPGDYGVADLVALSDDELLVLERGWSRGFGNTARIYRTSLAEPTTSCLGKRELLADSPVTKKTLFVDLGSLVAHGLPATKQRQASPLLDNFEGLTRGPRLPDGRQSLIVISDDNARADQFARIVVLAVG